MLGGLGGEGVVMGGQLITGYGNIILHKRALMRA